VVNCPEVASIEGSPPPVGRSCLLGIVTGCLPYHDIAISEQTHRPRAVFEENSGLALVHPVDYIEATIEQHAAGRRAPAPGQAAAEGI